MKRISTVGPKSCGGVGPVCYLRPDQFLDHHGDKKANTRGALQRTNARDTLADGSITDFVPIIPTFGKANTTYTSFF